MKKIAALLILLACSISLLAKPARPGFFRYTQPDGSTILIQRHGDEWAHWTTNQAGQVVRMDADGFYRVVEGVTAETAAQAASIRRKARKQMASARRANAPIAVGQKHFLVVLVNFSDLSFTTDNPNQAISNMLNQVGYSEHGAAGSARDYYYENAHGLFEPIFDVYGPVTLPQKMAYYGGNDSQGNDKYPEVAVKDACQLLDDVADFSDYDLDGDGYVDLVYMVYAGKGEADGGEDDTIWPHQWYLTAGGINLTLDGKRIDRYACGSELNGQGGLDGLGTICHEFGHAMGLPDFYDTDYAINGQGRTLLEYSLMDSGSYNNNGWTPPYLNMEERIMIGWLDESSILEFPKNGAYTLESVQNNVGYKIPTDTEGEYILLECRSKTGWDKFLPAEGLIAYHVDKSSRKVSISTDYGTSSIAASTLWSDWVTYNAINENGKHPCFYVVASASPYDCSYGMQYYADYSAYYYSKPDTDIPFPGGKNVTSYAPKGWSENATEISLSGIAYAANKASFTVSGVVTAGLDYPLIVQPENYTAGSSFPLEVELPDGYVAGSVKWTVDGAFVSGASVSLAAGLHVIEAEVTAEGGRKDVVTLEITVK